MTPYMRDNEFEYFEKLFASLPNNAKIVEWGSGGSTMYMLDNLKKKQTLMSIEHDTEWAKKLIGPIDNFNKKLNQVRYFVTGLPTIQCEKDGLVFINPDFEEHKKFQMGRFLEENPSYISNYIDPTYAHADFADVFESDFFFVDGLARGAVLATIKAKATKKDPIILLHDYTGRELQYEWAIRLFKIRDTHETFISLIK